MAAPKKVSPVYLILGGIVVVAAIVLNLPGDDTAKVAVKNAPPKTSVQVQGDFTKEDVEAKFNPVNVQVVNAFKPVVARKSAGIDSGKTANLVPSEYAGGADGWVYTGNAEIDGVPTALLENRTTQDGVFLKQGDRWKTSVVERITPTTVELSGAAGTVTLSLVNEDSVKGASAGSGQGMADMNGDIGPFNPMQGGNNFGGGPGGNRRGRGGRGGGRGGGGRGGGGRGGGNNGAATDTSGGDTSGGAISIAVGG